MVSITKINFKINKFSKWGDVFGDNVIVSAIIDRLVHHCQIVKITGMSYRIKDKTIYKEEN